MRILTNPKIPRNKTQEFVHEMRSKKIRVVLDIIMWEKLKNISQISLTYISLNRMRSDAHFKRPHQRVDISEILEQVSHKLNIYHVNVIHTAVSML